MCPRDSDEVPKDKSLDGTAANATGGGETTAVTLQSENDYRSELELRVTPEMCHYCFDALVSEIIPCGSKDRKRVGNARNGYNNPSAVPNFTASLPPAASCPIFVTWDKRKVDGIKNGFHRSSSSPCAFSSCEKQSDLGCDSSVEQHQEFELRGCIGTLAPRPLATAVREYALTSAFRDRRFDPIRLHEVPHLRVAVSLLVKYEECNHIYDWTIGVHGILIKFSHLGAQYSATYLPEVPLEQGWNQQEAVRSLVRKAGFRGDITESLLAVMGCTRYQSSKDRMTYDDYVKMLGSDPLAADLLGHEEERKRRGWRSCFNF